MQYHFSTLCFYWEQCYALSLYLHGTASLYIDFFSRETDNYKSSAGFIMGTLDIVSKPPAFLSTLLRLTATRKKLPFKTGEIKL